MDNMVCKEILGTAQSVRCTVDVFDKINDRSMDVPNEKMNNIYCRYESTLSFMLNKGLCIVNTDY